MPTRERTDEQQQPTTTGEHDEVIIVNGKPIKSLTSSTKWRKTIVKDMDYQTPNNPHPERRMDDSAGSRLGTKRQNRNHHHGEQPTLRLPRFNQSNMQTKH
jgi:hypothetical protein